MQTDENASPHLKKTLGPWMLWGLGVGYVISGMYFGWNLGLPVGGTYGMALATAIITIMYLTFTFSYSELACSIPKAGGVFDYANVALGKDLGFIAGMAQNIEFIFAPPAIAFAIGAYFHIFFPSISVIAIAVVAYFIFTSLNIYGVKAAASFELLITVFAVAELLLFAGVTLPHFQLEKFTADPLPNGWGGAFAAIPFAIWFFLGIECVANVAEEAINPQRNILIGFGSAILTLTALCALTFMGAVGVDGWKSVVFVSGTETTSDSPLPMALSIIVGNSHLLYHLLITVGLFGLVASFHGIILAAGRSSYEFGKVGYAPSFLGKINSKFNTPANALLVNMLIGIVALLTGKTTEIITIACFGALTLYIISMISLFVLRKKQPELARPFKVPLYPIFPAIALIIAIVSFVAMVVYNHQLSIIYIVMLVVAIICFKLFYRKGAEAQNL